MENLEIFSNSSVDWSPSAVVALATSDDGSQVAAAREDGSVEIWLVSPGSVGWHCQLNIHGNPNSRVSSMVWLPCCSKGGGRGRLLSSSIDGSISEWDFLSLQQKIILDSIGVSIWQMALEPIVDSLHYVEKDLQHLPNGNVYHDGDSNSESINSDGDDDQTELNDAVIGNKNLHLALACDDGCVRLYAVEEGNLTYKRSFPRVSGRTLSVAWSLDAKLLFSGSSDGVIRCWNTTSFHEAYRITVGLGGLGSGFELCVWALVFLRCGTLVSGDSTGSAQFWDSRHGTLLQNHTYHKGDINALAASPSHNRIFSAGSDGQVILYKRSRNATDLAKVEPIVDHSHSWIYVGYVRVHTHDVRALTVAVPISSEVSSPNDKSSGKVRHRDRSINFTYHQWAHLGVPMLISGGDDTKLFAYSAREFTQYSPHDICPAPQRILVQMVPSAFDGASLLLAQHGSQLKVFLIKAIHPSMPSAILRRKATTQVIAHVKSKESRKIISSAISNTGCLFAYSDHVKPCIFQLKQLKSKKSGWSVNKLQLRQQLPHAHCMVFSVDSSRLILAGHDRKIYVLDVKSLELVHTFLPQGKEGRMSSVPHEPPITRMFTSSDGQWLASVNCFGDIYVFNLETYRQHWFISRFDGASVTAGGFPPSNSNVLVITTSLNQIYVLDVEAKQLGEWSRRHKNSLPRRFQDFPGEVIGLSFPPNSTSVMIYSSRAMCLIDFGMPIHQDDELSVSQDQFLDKQVMLNSAKANKKRKKIVQEMNFPKKMNFEFCAFKDPIFFVGHLSENSVFVLEKPWVDVVKNFDAPVHRHIYGT